MIRPTSFYGLHRTNAIPRPRPPAPRRKPGRLSLSTTHIGLYMSHNPMSEIADKNSGASSSITTWWLGQLLGAHGRGLCRIPPCILGFKPRVDI